VSSRTIAELAILFVVFSVLLIHFLLSLAGL
jgi:hypothetical protein